MKSGSFFCPYRYSRGTALSTYLGRTSRRTVSPTAQGTSVTSSASWVAPITPAQGSAGR